MPSRKKDDIAAKLRASIRLPRRAKRPYLGFTNDGEEHIFRALAAVHPKAVRVPDAGWQIYADKHVKLGNFSCVIRDVPHYRLTSTGLRRAVEERLLKDGT